MIGSLCMAARALVQTSRPLLAKKAGIAENVIEAFEDGVATPDSATIQALKSTLEELGAVFIPEDKVMGAGVRLRFNRSATKRLAVMENEGGPARSDDVP